MIMRNDYYILENGEIIKANLITWARWLESDKDFDKRRVSETNIGNVKISTVFLGLNHNFGAGDPLIFETMIFGGEHDDFQVRYSTLEDAMRGHEQAVAMVHNTHTPPADEPAGDE